MPVSSSRPKRKSRGDAYAEDNGCGGTESAAAAGTLEKENGALLATKKKKRRDDGAEKPPSKKQKKASAPVQTDDGFVFRPRVTRSAKADETAQSAQTPSSSSLPPPPAPDPPKRKAPKKRAVTPPPPSPPQPPPPPPEQPKKSKSKKEKKATPVAVEEDADNDVNMVQEVVVEKKKKGKKKEKAGPAAAVAPASPPPPSRIPVPIAAPTPAPPPGGTGDAMKVVLHMSDTPIIRKNQQLRKGQGGNRRSSVGLRGRRASSLMDTGIIAEPHAEIAPEDFYKHIHDEIVEPQRMKQLLSWCGRRALTPPAPTGDKNFNARSIARIIEEKLLDDVLADGALSSWFNRAEDTNANVTKKPNPRNAESLAKIEECQANLKRLRDEKETWLTLLKSANTLSLGPGDGDTIDTSLWLPAEAAFASRLNQSPDLLGSAKRAVKQQAGEIEFQVDQLIDGIHKLQQFGEAADRLGATVLEDSERELAKREVRVRQVAGTEGLPLQEVLRSLSRMDR